MKRLALGVFALFGAYLFTGIAEIHPGERAVVKRFGRIVARPGPGLWFGLPWGMDTVDRVPITQVRRITVGFQPREEGDSADAGVMLTGDENLVELRVHIDFAVAEGDASLDEYVLHRAQAETIIGRETEAALTEWASGASIDRLLITGSSELPRWLMTRVQGRLEPYHLGVRIQSASVVRVAPPEEVRRDFERVNQAEAVNRTRVSQARQEESQLLRQAESTDYRLRQQAIAYKERSNAIAQADADAFELRVTQYYRTRRANPQILSLIWWDEMSKLFGLLHERGRIELLDSYLGPDGLDLSRLGLGKAKQEETAKKYGTKK